MKEFTATPLESTGQADTTPRKNTGQVDTTEKGLRDLPEGWVWTTLGKTGQLLRGVSYRKEDASEQPKNDFVPILRATNIQGEKLVLASDLVYVPSRYVKAEQYLEPGDIVVCMSSGSKHLVGKTAQLFQEWIGSFGTFCAAIRPNSAVNPKFLGYFFSSPEYRQFIREKSAGININNLKPSDFETLEIPLPPLPEQERIVARLEELLSDLEAGAAALGRVKAGVKRYKASVLKAACEGRLFGDEVADGELPVGWRWIKMDELADIIGGVTKGRDLTGKATIMLPYLRVANVQRGRLDLDVMKEIEILASEIEKYRLEDGDVVLTEGGDWDKLGRSAIWRNQIPNCIHQNHIFRARVKSSFVLPEWLMYYTNSEQGQNYFKEAAKQTTNLASINMTQLRACPIPLPTMGEQQRIVEEVERRLEAARAVEAAVEAGLKRAGRLRQAVLKAAFEGRLL
jgi:type I restriction enzyme S subunit